MSACGDNARAIDQVDTTSERDILPHFRLARDGRDFAHLAAFQSVYDTALADVRISNEANRDLFLVGV